MKTGLKSLCLLFVAALFGGIASAADWTPYELRTAAFQVPASWEVTRRARDSSYDFKSNEGQYELWASWWFPDEPLLGYPDIVHHEKRSVAGQETLFIHIESGNQRTLQLAFLKHDEEGEQFLLQLHADKNAVSQADHTEMFDALVARLVYEGVSAGSPPEKSETKPPNRTGFTVPPGWKSIAPDQEFLSLTQQIYLAPGGDRLIWIVQARRGEGDQAGWGATKVANDFAGFLYGEHLVVKSIDAETYPDMAGGVAYAVGVTANVFPVGAAALPYKRAKAVVYRGGDDERAFVIVTIRALDADRASVDELERMALTFDFGATAQAPVTKPSGDWLSVVKAQYGNDCTMLDVTSWSHPTRPVLEEAKAQIEWVALCRDRTYPIFGTKVPYDMRTATGGYFNPLYDALLTANCPLIHSVGRAGPQAPRLIDLTWGREAAPKVTLVGKGVCFDTGGLNLKPANSMGLMKKDMGGAATVLGLAHMIMGLGLPIRLRVLIPAVENSVSAGSMRPGDILTARNGMTVEINNTDAEGRLVLADALCLAAEDNPDLVIDMATLTGAARVALGPEVVPFFTPDDDLAVDLARASRQVADPIWRLPLWPGYERDIEPGIADLDNAPKGGFAGSITAALFLQRFAGTTRWAHFDIYGWTPTGRPGRPKGAECQAARAVLQMLEARYPRGT